MSITVEEALKKKYLRVVPVGTRGYPEAYKDKPFEDYKKYLDKDVTLINVEKKFYLMKDKEIANKTFTAKNGNSLIYRDDETISVKVKASDFVRTTLNDKTLKTPIINVTEVYEKLLIESFAELALKVINKEPLSKKQIASLIVDERTDRVLDLKEMLPIIKSSEIEGAELSELIEILKQSSPRARLLVQEYKDGADKPLALGLFKSKLIREIIRLK